MTRLIGLTLAIGLSLLLYLLVFSVVKRPLTIGEIPVVMASKQAYARTLASPKVVVFAGSNGRYSHRCETIAQVTGRPCANLSVAVGIGLDYQFGDVLDLLRPGDLVYLPLEYSQYGMTDAQLTAGTENLLLVHYDREHLWTLPPSRIARAYGSFDLSFLVQGLVETALAARGHQRRSGATSLTPQGDERDHTAARAAPYRPFLLERRHVEPDLPAATAAQSVIGAFIDAARQRGAMVVAGLPTLPHDAVVPLATESRVRALYERHATPLLVLPGASRYPLDCFYDTHSHLHEECQIAHSRAVAEGLKPWL